MNPFPRRTFRAVALIAAVASPAGAADRYWNPSILSDTWDAVSTDWAATTGGAPSFAWASGDNAFFSQAATYTVTLSGVQTAAAVRVSAGNVTLAGVAGTDLLSTASLTIDSGASLTAAGDVYLRSGVTTLTVNGTLIQTGGPATSTRRVSIAGGSGEIQVAGNLRTSGNVTFAGNITGSGGILTDAAGTFDLSGNNTYSGNTLLRNGNVLRLGSTTALSANTLLRLGGGTNIIELSGTDFSRTVGGSSGNVRFHGGADGAGSSGFAAVGADRTVALNGTVQWGSANFNPATFHLGTAASTHKVTLTTNIDLNGATRTINVSNGSAAVEGEISGSLTGGAGSVLNKTGTGVLLLSNSNSHAGGTTIAGDQSNINPLRISHSNALGSGALTIGSGGNSDRARLELTGGISVTNAINVGSRNTPSGFTYAAPAIVNLSGNNSLTSNLSSGSGGGQVTIQSDGGKLTLTGNMTTRTLNLLGAGDGEATGSLGMGVYGLVKDGSGTWTLGGNGSYTGATEVKGGGKLLINGALGNTPTAVSNGTLGGTGSLTGSVTVSSTGVLAPGLSIGALASGALSFTDGAAYQYELNTAAVTGDRMDVTGDLGLDGAVTLNLLDLGANAALTLGTKFTLIAYSGTWSPGDTFTGYADDSVFSLFGNQWRINYDDTPLAAVNGGSLANAVTLTVVPEPGTTLLGALGLLALLRRRRIG